jgi:hypothetical protein
MELLEMNYGSSNYFGSLSSTVGAINQTLVFFPLFIIFSIFYPNFLSFEILVSVDPRHIDISLWSLELSIIHSTTLWAPLVCFC